MPVGASSGLERGTVVRRELQGNVLLLMLKPRFPADNYSDLAGKTTGMLLEGLDAAEMGQVLTDETLRNDYVRESLGLLVEAGDERAVRALAEPVPAPAPAPAAWRGAGLTVDIGAALETAAADSAGSTSATGLTPAFGGSWMRMSPRVSSNKYQTTNILAAGSS